MKILSLNFVNEGIDTSRVAAVRNSAKNLGLDIDKTRDAVTTNREFSNTIDKVATVNKFRGFHFAFIDNKGKRVNEINQTLVYIVKGDIVSFFPYTKQGLVIDDPNIIGFINENSTTPSYFSLSMTDFQNNIIHPITYFNEFIPYDSSIPKQSNNVFKYTLEIGPNFDKINKKFGITGNLLNLNNMVNQPLIDFINITDEKIIDVNYDENSKNKQYILSIKVEFINGFVPTPDEKKILDNFNNLLNSNTNNIYNIGINHIPSSKYPGTNYRYESIFSRSNVTRFLITNYDFFYYTKQPLRKQFPAEMYNSSAIGSTNRAVFPVLFTINEFKPFNRKQKP